MQTKEYKLLLLGEKQIGKTCFLKRLNNTYSLNNNYIPTLGVDVTSIDMNKEFGKIRLNIWDTAGQENFNSIIRSYYRGVACACIVIDVSDHDALNNASKWLKEYDTLKSPNTVGMPIIIGNKTDLKREYTYEEGEGWANDNGCMYWEMSAKNNDNTSGLLYFVGNNIFNNWDGESKVSGVQNNKLKENIEMTVTHRDNFLKSCCSIV